MFSPFPRAHALGPPLSSTMREDLPYFCGGAPYSSGRLATPATTLAGRRRRKRPRPRSGGGAQQRGPRRRSTATQGRNGAIRREIARGSPHAAMIAVFSALRGRAADVARGRPPDRFFGRGPVASRGRHHVSGERRASAPPGVLKRSVLGFSPILRTCSFPTIPPVRATCGCPVNTSRESYFAVICASPWFAMAVACPGAFIWPSSILIKGSPLPEA